MREDYQRNLQQSLVDTSTSVGIDFTEITRYGNKLHNQGFCWPPRCRLVLCSESSCEPNWDMLRPKTAPRERFKLFRVSRLPPHFGPDHHGPLDPGKPINVTFNCISSGDNRGGPFPGQWELIIEHQPQPSETTMLSTVPNAPTRATVRIGWRSCRPMYKLISLCVVVGCAGFAYADDSAEIPTVVLAFTGTSVVPAGVYADDSQQQNPEIYGGKTLDEWIGQAKQGRRLEDREDALQVLRNHGLRHDRDKTLRAFTELLSDKAPTVRSLAAVGLRKAGRPTDPKAAAKLVEIISQDLSGLKLPRKAGEVGGEFGGVMRAIGALEVIGETDHIPALKRVSENEKVDSIIRQSAAKAVGQIEKRASEGPPESVQAHTDDSANSIVDPGDEKVVEDKTLVVTVFDKPLYLEDLTPAQAEVKRKELPQAEFDQWLRQFRGAELTTTSVLR